MQRVAAAAAHPSFTRAVLVAGAREETVVLAPTHADAAIPPEEALDTSSDTRCAQLLRVGQQHLSRGNELVTRQEGADKSRFPPALRIRWDEVSVTLPA